MRATPPWDRMSRGRAPAPSPAHAPASSAMRACSGVTTSMMTPPRSIWARPTLTEKVAAGGLEDASTTFTLLPLLPP
ncbi:hypothetical protein PR202_ga06704 [Eleusine coracana subsp. coracana]|uniref:Uncharacterized protein n=1 Tax=Eleusine coracana subsp. coracana TaxID=191504 RepID=A0AAV5BW09_ELECO|nr:hypothetical protein PR202_ga06704 [Eleusine coracana subsp. coracana]